MTGSKERLETYYSEMEEGKLLHLAKYEFGDLDFDAKGSHARLDFGTARNWTAASDQFWCTLSATSGDKNAASNVFVTVDPNASGIDRTAIITLSTADGKGTYKVKVFQSRY